MTQRRAITGQKPTGTGKLRHMLLTSCIKEAGSGQDTQMDKLKNKPTGFTTNYYRPVGY